MKPGQGCWTCKGQNNHQHLLIPCTPFPPSVTRLREIGVGSPYMHIYKKNKRLLAGSRGAGRAVGANGAAGRKIGCDRQLPECGNCIRTGRKCQGYEVRLAWPDKHDGRRKTQELSLDDVFLLPLRQAAGGASRWQFLNMNVGDMTTTIPTLPTPDLQSLVRCPRNPSWWPDLEGEPGLLLDYYENKIARMISTIDARNGFRMELLPWALSQAGHSFAALRNAILAVAALHKFGPDAAMPFKSKALSSLAQSFAADEGTPGSGAAQAQLGASMMLCVYSVFDETDGTWHLHLNGAKGILGRNGTTSSFLWTWFLYHEVLGAFSRPYMESSRGKPPTIDPDQEELGLEAQLIIGSLGCSLEVLHLIGLTNTIRNTEPKPADHLERCLNLERRLLNLKQHIPCDEEDKLPYTPAQHAKILQTADLYRMAALLYLRRVSPAPVPGEPDPLPKYVVDAFAVLQSLESWTSPWPLFVLACEAETDEQRMAILAALSDMDERRGIGNVFVLRNIIESVWKQKDLNADTGQPWVFKWWDPNMVDSTTPWFI
ncbi:hypothetical protein GQ53DRAFT_754479 [Thozetella sp. PMI_491]|nr:hypothetical protein GQ53DRAFT_754479 [Thozetella sp. PMI_491]